MSIHVVVYSGGKWEVANGNIEYVPFDCTKRGLEVRTGISYLQLFSKISDLCSLPNITRLSYKMSTFTDPIDILDDRDLKLFFKMVDHNRFEIFRIYVVQDFGAGSSIHQRTYFHDAPEGNFYKTPDLNVTINEGDSFSFPSKFDSKFESFYDKEVGKIKSHFVPETSEKHINDHTDTVRASRFPEGHMFRNKEEMKLELGKMCLEQCFQFKVDKSSKSRFEASCLSAGCDWRIRAYNMKGSCMFYVKYFNDEHTCSKTQTHPHLRQANKKVLGNILKDQVNDSGRVYRGKEIIKDIGQRFKVNISYSQAWRGKSYALEMLRGSSKDSFSELPLYCHNLKKANPGTVTRIQTDELSRFEMVFVAIGAAVRSFIFNLRPLVIIDAAHLKGDFKGTMFLAVGMDGNNQIFPLAYGIGKSESGESWVWFLNHLKECIGEPPDLAIISDRAASIDLAIRTVFPNAFHGLCCRHLMMNLRLKSKKAKQHESLWWKTCKAYRLSDFQESFNALCEAIPRVKDTLLNVGLGKWARAHCPGQRYNIMTSNSAESINALSKHARKMPITQLIEFFRESVQKWFYDRRRHGFKTTHQLTEWAQKKIEKKIAGSKSWTVCGIGENTFEVEDGRRKGFVDLRNQTCTCRVWQLSGFPCGHVIAVSRFLNETDCSHYTSLWFTNEVYKNTYEEVVNPLPHKSEWEFADGLIDLQPPLMTKRQAGRPRENNRIMSRGEEPTAVRCSRCKKHGHHRDQCSLPMPSQISANIPTCEDVPDTSQDTNFDISQYQTYNLYDF